MAFISSVYASVGPLLGARFKVAVLVPPIVMACSSAATAALGANSSSVVGTTVLSSYLTALITDWRRGVNDVSSISLGVSDESRLRGLIHATRLITAGFETRKERLETRPSAYHVRRGSVRCVLRDYTAANGNRPYVGNSASVCKFIESSVAANQMRADTDAVP
jgi:hypothetical protein